MSELWRPLDSAENSMRAVNRYPSEATRRATRKRADQPVPRNIPWPSIETRTDRVTTPVAIDSYHWRHAPARLVAGRGAWRRRAVDMVPGSPAQLHSLRTPALLVTAGLYVSGVASLLRVVADALFWPLVGVVGGLVAALLIVAPIYTFATFLVWLYPARENLDLRGLTGMRWAKGWTVGGWFIPLADLVIPARVVGEVYARSEPNAIRSWTMPRVVLGWWIALILTFFRFTYQTVDEATGVAQVHGARFWDVVNGLAGVAAAVLAVRLVRQVTAWQADWASQPTPSSH